MKPWNQGDFVKAVRETRDILHNALKDEYPASSFTWEGSCKWGCDFSYSNYVGPLGHQPGFTEVPPEWYSSYYEYRAILQEFLVVNSPFMATCATCSGTITQQQADAYNAALPSLYDRSAKLLASIQP